jgi:formylglycine-generating enzyme required for sulfatase activity
VRHFIRITIATLAALSISAAGEPLPTNMALIPATEYQVPYRSESDAKKIPVSAFAIDIFPVTNGDFLQFVKANPTWRRSQVKRIFADESYLSHWTNDLELGGSDSQAPVTRVSWFAARAYARWKGKRLPTTAEWEVVALASEKAANGESDPEFRRRLQALYFSPACDVLPRVGSKAPNFYGVYDMHGGAWEWVADFSTAMVTGDARGDTGLDRQLFCGSTGQNAKDRSDFPAFMRFAFRSSLKASYTVPNLGFRCVKDL